MERDPDKMAKAWAMLDRWIAVVESHVRRAEATFTSLAVSAIAAVHRIGQSAGNLAASVANTWTTIKGYASTFMNEFGHIVPVILAVAEVVAGLVAAFQTAGFSLELVADGVLRLNAALEHFDLGFLSEGARQAVQALASPLYLIVEWIGKAFELLGKFAPALVGLSALLNIANTLHVWEALTAVVNALGSAVQFVAQALWQMARWSPIGIAIRVAFAAISTAIAAATFAVRVLWDTLMLLPRALNAIADALTAGLSAAVNLIASLPGRLASTAQAAGQQLAASITAGLAVAFQPGKYIVAPLTNAAASAANAVGSVFQSIADKFAAVADRISGLGSKLTSQAARILDPLKDAAGQFAAAGKDVQDLAEKSGLSAAALTEMGYAAKLVGSSVDSLAGAVAKMSENADGSKMADLLKQLNVNAVQFAASNPEQKFLALGTAIAGIKDPLERAAAAEVAFGSAGEKLVKVFERGPEGLAAVRAEAQKLGLVFDGPAAAAARQFTDVMAKVKDATAGLWQTIGSAVAPLLTDAAQRTVALIKIATQWASENKPLIVTIFKVASAVATVGTVLTTVAGLLGGFATVFSVLAGAAGSVATAVTIVGGVLAAVLSPMAVLIAASAGLAAWLGTLVPWMRAFHATVDSGRNLWSNYAGTIKSAINSAMAVLAQIRDFATKVFGGIEDAIRAGNVQLAIEVAWAGALAAWTRGLNAIASVTDVRLAGILHALAAGDWRSAADQAMLALKAAMQRGVNSLDGVWTGFRGSMDSMLTWLVQRWNSAFATIRASLYEWADSLNKSIVAPLAAVGVPGAEAMNKALINAKHALADGINVPIDIDLDALKRKLEEARARLAELTSRPESPAADAQSVAAARQAYEQSETAVDQANQRRAEVIGKAHNRAEIFAAQRRVDTDTVAADQARDTLAAAQRGGNRAEITTAERNVQAAETRRAESAAAESAAIGRASNRADIAAAQQAFATAKTRSAELFQKVVEQDGEKTEVAAIAAARADIQTARQQMAEAIAKETPIQRRIRRDADAANLAAADALANRERERADALTGRQNNRENAALRFDDERQALADVASTAAEKRAAELQQRLDAALEAAKNARAEAERQFAKVDNNAGFDKKALQRAEDAKKAAEKQFTATASFSASSLLDSVRGQQKPEERLVKEVAETKQIHKRGLEKLDKLIASFDKAADQLQFSGGG